MLKTKTWNGWDINGKTYNHPIIGFIYPDFFSFTLEKHIYGYYMHITLW